MSVTLFGKYRLGERIARGGMAEIYHAQVIGASGFAREIVVKRILPDLVEDEEFRTMFEDEAKLAARLEHPNIVQIFDFDREGDSFYIAMEYVRGADCAMLIRAAAERSERLPPEVAVLVVSEVLEGLRYAHALRDEDGHPLGIIHRDISPANVLLSYAGAVKLADFGIAKAATSMVRTSAGILKGKYPYMSPEQAAGRALDHRSDLFSVGIVLYQALTGRRPFRGKDSVELLERVMGGEYQPARTVNPELAQALDDVVAKALAVDVADRYQDAGEFLADLRQALPQTPTREDLETCLRRLVPEKPRTLSGQRPSPDLAPTMRVSGASFRTGREPVDPLDPTTRESLRSVGERGAGRPGVRLAGLAALLLALAAVGVFAGLYFSGVVGGADGTDRRGAQAETSTAQRTFTVLVRRSPDQEQELRRHGLDRALEARGLSLRLMRFEQYDDLFQRLRHATVDLASVPLVATKALVREDLVVPAGRLAGEDLEAMRARFSPAALEAATVDTAVGSDIAFVPELLEVHLVVYRVSKVAWARERWTTHRAEIEAALRVFNGRGLPAGYELEEDPSEWDEFDVFVVGWVWAHDAEEGQPAPRLAMRSESYWPSVEALLEWASRVGDDRVSWMRRDSLRDVFLWLALHREAGIQRGEVWDESPAARANGTSIGLWFARGEIYLIRANQFRIAELQAMVSDGRHGFDMDDIGIAALPAGSSLSLGADGAPERAGRHDGLVNAWLWAVPTNATDPRISLEVALELASPQVQLHFAGRNCWIPTVARVDLASVGDAVPPHCQRAIALGLDRLSRRIQAVFVPEVGRVAGFEAQFMRLWNELLVGRGYRPTGGEGFDAARFDSVLARNLPER